MPDTLTASLVELRAIVAQLVWDDTALSERAALCASARRLLDSAHVEPTPEPAIEEIELGDLRARPKANHESSAPRLASGPRPPLMLRAQLALVLQCLQGRGLPITLATLRDNTGPAQLRQLATGMPHATDIGIYLDTLGDAGLAEIELAKRKLGELANDPDANDWLAGAIERGIDVCSQLAAAITA